MKPLCNDRYIRNDPIYQCGKDAGHQDDHKDGDKSWSHVRSLPPVNREMEF